MSGYKCVRVHACVRMCKCENEGSMWKCVLVCVHVCEYEYE